MGRPKGTKNKNSNVSFNKRCEILDWDPSNPISSVLKDSVSKSVAGQQVCSKKIIPIPAKRRRGAA